MEPRPIVLVADDDADTREMYEACLGLSGFTVELAADGVEAWEKTQALLPDIVVTDLTLPRLDGYGLCRRMRDDPRTSDIPALAVSGWAGKSVDDNVRDAGFRTSLLKPVPLDTLIEVIRQVVDEARSLRAKSAGIRSRIPRLLSKSSRLLKKSEALQARINDKK